MQPVLYKFELPQFNKEEEEEDLKAAFKAHKPEFTEKFAMGNTFETRLKDRQKNSKMRWKRFARKSSQ